MKIQILCVGKLKERHWQEAAGEYVKRMGRFCQVDVMERKEEKLPEQASPAEEERVIAEESRRLSEQIDERSYVIALDRTGRMLDSPELAAKIGDLGLSGRSRLTFVIGGSLGLSKELLGRADYRLSFSRFTFPHQLMRVVLLEQIYRSFKILRGEIYHK